MRGLATLMGATVFVCLALEVAVRLVIDDGMHFYLEMWKYARDIKQRSEDSLIGHEHRPNARSFLMGVEVSTNSYGQRDREFEVARPPGGKRIVMLGDSFVLGWGVPLEQTVSKRIERMFAASGQRVEVMSTGVGNYNTVMEVQAFLTKYAPFAPDLVVLNYTFNDAEPVPKYEGVGLITRYSQAYTVSLGAFDAALRLARISRQPWDEYYLGLYQTPGWQAAQASAHRLARYCNEHGIALVVVNWPELHDTRNYQLGAITNHVRDMAKAAGVPFLDLLDALKGQDPAKLWVTPPDPHPNGFANQLYAEHMFPFIARALAEAGRGKVVQSEPRP